MKTIAGTIRVSDQQLEEIKRHHEAEAENDRALYAALSKQVGWTSHDGLFTAAVDQ